MKVDVGGVRLEVEDHGEGVPVILLHGFPLSSEMWTPVRTAIEQVARLVTPDLRGFGGSDAPVGDYGMETLAGDVLQLADRLGLQRFVLGGHSMGGYVALRLADRQPDRLAGLVLVDTKAAPDTGEARARRDEAIARIGRGEREAFLDGFVANLFGRSSKERAPRQIAEMRAIAGAIPDHVLAGCVAGMRDRADSSGLLARLDIPALVVVGEEDAITPREVGEAMASALPHARLAVIPLAGHTPSVERPIPTAEAIVDFLGENFPRPAAAIGPRRG